MTNSMDKVHKAKGPIRWEAILPTVVVLAALGIYFNLFFDNHVRRALEYVSTQIHGAEINIGRLSTSFWGARLEIDDIQITDKNKPERNLAQVGKIRFELVWDALLRAKMVVNEAKVLNIQALTPRSKPGYIIPPPPPESASNSVLQRVQTEVLAQTRKKFNANFLSDIANMIGGTDPKEQLKNIQAELKSDLRIKELEKELNNKKLKWEQRLKELPQAEDLKDYQKRIKNLKLDPSNPGEFAQNLKTIETIIREADQKVKLFEATSREIKNDTDNYVQSFKDLEKMVAEDIRDLQKRFKIPNLDSREFSEQLFMSMLEKRLVGIRKYVEIARKYMPPKRTEKQKLARAEEAIVPRNRGEGRNYRFAITTGYPLFWLKSAQLSSELGQSQYSGDIKGEIRDLTTDQVYLKKPTVLLAQGNFPKQNIFGMDVKITLDHTTEVARDIATVKIDQFPVENAKFSDSDQIRLGMRKALGQSHLQAEIVDDQIKMDLRGSFSDLTYDIETKDKQVKAVLEAILKDISKITLNAGVKGSLSEFNLHVNSNLGDELAKGFKKQVEAKITEAQSQLRKLVDERIAPERDRLRQEMDKILGTLTKDLDAKKAETDKIVQETKSELKSEKSKNTGKRLEEEGKKLLKKLKFGG